jgi:hypothetical protein
MHPESEGEMAGGDDLRDLAQRLALEVVAFGREGTTAFSLARRILRHLREGEETAAAPSPERSTPTVYSGGIPITVNHVFKPRGVNGVDRMICRECGREERDQIHNGSLA